MIKARVCVLGHFGFGKELLNGQTIKTKIVTKELETQLGKADVLKIDTHGGISTLFKAPFQIQKAMKCAKNVIILPANNGLRVYVPLLYFFNKIYKGRKMHYIVIGGWLSDFLKGKKILSGQLKVFDGIYVETNIMKNALERQGFTNIKVMPNCKELTPLNPSELVYATSEPYKLCTFSRVMKEKGIADAVDAVNTINEKYGREIYALDIYGQVDSNQAEWFDNLKNTFPSYIHYGGLVSYDKSVEILKNYYALVFPTLFYTEGIPGTIIDAYAAGIPVVSSKWESFEDIIDEGGTGVGYEFGKKEKLIEALDKIYKEKEEFISLKKKCLKKSRQYIPNVALKVILEEIK